MRTLVVVFGVLASLALGLAPAASAASDTGVDMTQACRYTYNGYQYTARAANWGNPFSWVCGYSTTTVGLPPSFEYVWTPVGGVDVQKFCSIARPGSRAVIVAWNAGGWRCRK